MSKRRILAGVGVGLTALIVSAIPVVADPGPKPGFYRMFEGVPGFTEPTQQQIADLAQTMLDPNADAGDNPGTSSGFTYFGQFLDHDITLDNNPAPVGPVDPTTLENSRTYAFDLDSVYTDAPESHVGDVFDAAGHFILQEPNANGVRDYPRRADGSAIIFEGRNDENQIIAQIQIGIMKAHNRLIDAGLSLQDARQTLVTAYQEAIFNDFLPHTISPVDDKQVKKLDPKKTGTPIEFSVAAYRFGHSQVRRAYILNEGTGKIQVFSATAPDLRGGRPLNTGRQIHWGEFFADIPLADADGNPINVSRRIDTLISSGLFVLPIPGAAASGSNVLAFRNMSRGVFYSLPSGETVAKQLGIPVLPLPSVGPGFSTGTPLWYYILLESQFINGGTKLGPVGSTIVAAGFQAALKNGDKLVKGKTDGTQLALLRGADGAMTVSDLFVFAGVSQGT